MVHEDENDIDFVSATPGALVQFFMRTQASSQEALKEMRFCRDTLTEGIGEVADRLKAMETAHANITKAINIVREELDAHLIPTCAAESAQEASAES